MTRKRLLIALGVALVTVGAVWWLAPRERRGPFWDKYQRVQPGMTEDEVGAILGPPTYEEYPGGSLGPHICDWDEEQQMICVSFDYDTTGRDPPGWGVAKKRFLPETAWEKLRRHGTDMRSWKREWP